MAESLIDQLTREFMRFPGIGPRQAKRFVYYLLRADRATLEMIARDIRDLKQSISQCADCKRYYPKTSQPSPLCPLCADPSRDHSLLILIEKDMDLENVERSGTFNGYYFVLGGLVPILDKNPESSFRSRELFTLVERKIKGGALKEIIIAVSANVEGDHTIEFIKKFLEPLLPHHQLKISTLGRGLSTGTELEYSDPDTLKNALKHRE
jgi:recombination protein RecR